MIGSVVRVGNGGWSGWIDERGNRRSIMLDENRSVYFEGAATFSITRDSKLATNPTFFTRRGDWFAYACIALTVLGIALPLVRNRYFTSRKPGKPEGG